MKMREVESFLHLLLGVVTEGDPKSVVSMCAPANQMSGSGRGD